MPKISTPTILAISNCELHVSPAPATYIPKAVSPPASDPPDWSRPAFSHARPRLCWLRRSWRRWPLFRRFECTSVAPISPSDAWRRGSVVSAKPNVEAKARLRRTVTSLGELVFMAPYTGARSRAWMLGFSLATERPHDPVVADKAGQSRPRL